MFYELLISSKEQSINTFKDAIFVKLAPPSAIAVIEKLNVPDYPLIPLNVITNYEAPSFIEIYGVYPELDLVIET